MIAYITLQSKKNDRDSSYVTHAAIFLCFLSKFSNNEDYLHNLIHSAQILLYTKKKI